MINNLIIFILMSQIIITLVDLFLRDPFMNQDRFVTDANWGFNLPLICIFKAITFFAAILQRT